MILIEFQEGQGLGNQLWLYATARATADVLGLDLFIEGDHLFKGKNFLKIYYNSAANLSNDLKDSLIVYNEPFFYDNNFATYITYYDKDILNIKKNIILRGVFQSDKYLLKYQKKIDKILNFDTSFIGPVVKLDHNICVINLRGGEYKRFSDLILPRSYWKNAMTYMKKYKGASRFIIVTDDKYYARALFPNSEIISDNISLCFKYLSIAKKIIVSNSSFSYFPISLNKNKPFVIAPAQWARFGNPLRLWVAPCNYYKDWHWMDSRGKIVLHKAIMKDLKKTWHYYNSNFEIKKNWPRVPYNFYFNFKIKIKRLILKKISYFFPTLIG